jgi:hypothetical protein
MRRDNWAMFLKGDGSSKDDYLVSRQEPAKMEEQEPFFVAFCQKKKTFVVA